MVAVRFYAVRNNDTTRLGLVGISDGFPHRSWISIPMKQILWRSGAPSKTQGGKRKGEAPWGIKTKRKRQTQQDVLSHYLIWIFFYDLFVMFFLPNIITLVWSFEFLDFGFMYGLPGSSISMSFYMIWLHVLSSTWTWWLLITHGPGWSKHDVCWAKLWPHEVGNDGVMFKRWWT